MRQVRRPTRRSEARRNGQKSAVGDIFRLKAQRSVTLIGVPLDLGASRPGARLGPAVMRNAGLAAQLQSLRLSVTDAGDVAVPVAGSAGDADGGPGRPKNVAPVREANLNVSQAVAVALEHQSFPVILGGDHSLAVGALCGAARVKGPQGVIWIDAHADLNTAQSSPSGNIHGMSFAAALGLVEDIFGPPAFALPAADVTRCVLVGVRELDPQERQTIRERGIACFTMSDVDRLGMAAVMERAITHAARGPHSVHVSFDIDCLDPALAPGTGTPVRGGLTYREAHLAMEMLFESGVADSLEMVEVNPLLDEHNMTAKLANELICSLLGKTIL
jgi:arginase